MCCDINIQYILNSLFPLPTTKLNVFVLTYLPSVISSEHVNPRRCKYCVKTAEVCFHVEAEWWRRGWNEMRLILTKYCSRKYACNVNTNNSPFVTGLQCPVMLDTGFSPTNWDLKIVPASRRPHKPGFGCREPGSEVRVDRLTFPH